MSNNYPYYPQQPYRQPQPQFMEQQSQFMGIKGRPVSSLEEARAMSIDFDGSVFYFPDLANRRIYTKQINLDGTATLNVYEYKELPTQASYVTREEFENVIQQLRQSLVAATPPQQVAAAQPVAQASNPDRSANLKF